MEETNTPRTPCEENGHDFFCCDADDYGYMVITCTNCGEEYFEKADV